MPHDFSYEPRNHEPTAHVPGWELLTLLAFVVAALLALVLIPFFMKEHNTELRRDLFEMTTPLSERWSEFVRTTAAAESAIRSYIHTGEETYLEEFRADHSEAAKTASQIQDLVLDLDDRALTDEAQGLFKTWKGWVGESVALAQGNLSRQDFQELLPIHRKQYESVLDAERRFDRALDRAVQVRRATIQQAENRWAWLTAGLALMTIVAVGAVLWMGRRLHAANRRLQEYAREQTRLVRITKLLNEATDFEEALRRIARGVIELAQAHGAHVEQINVDRDEIEVVSAAGNDAPIPGTKGPYSGSWAESVLTSGEVETATVDAIEDNGRPVAPHRAALSTGSHLLVVPLYSEDTALGALLVNRQPTDTPFEESEIARLRILADMAALVLQRLYLFEEMHRNQQALRELNETLEERVKRRTARIRELASQLTMAEQKERRRIAQVLHDDLQQRLYGIQMRINFLRQYSKSGKQEQLLEEVKQAKTWIKEAIATTRRLSVDLSPPVLKKEGLVEALGWLRTQMKELHELDVDIETKRAARVPDKDMQVFLFQVVRELLFNVVKHAGVNQATVELTGTDDQLTICVADEGRGFNPDDTEEQTHEGGFGLTAARERLELFDGRLEIDAAPGEGTRMIVHVPLRSG